LARGAAGRQGGAARDPAAASWFHPPVNTTPRGGAAAKVLLAVLVLAALVAAYTYGSLRWSYSEGERAGYVQKLSRRGWVCKTWEGELAMVTMPGAIPEKFYFSVPSEAVAAKINQSIGKRVALTYQQHVGVPSSCFGDTPYFVSGVTVVE
jgi:hypothetical protein